MGDNENDASYHSRAYGMNNQQAIYRRTSNHYPGDEEENIEDDLGEEGEAMDVVRMIGKDNYDDDDDDDDNDDDEDDDEDEDDDDLYDGKSYNNGKREGIGIRRPQKKRKLKNLISNYEFAPRVPVPSTHQAAPSHPSTGGRNLVGEWTERETFALLDVWGDRFLKRGRKSLRSEEWQEVADKVSQETNIERTDTQCRNRLDTLKKKYKKEKMRMAAGVGGTSKWVFYNKMDMLMYSPPKQEVGLSCGIDSGEYVFMNPKVYLNRANGLDEMRDSPGNSESSRDEMDGSDELPPKGKRSRGRRTVNRSSFRLLADSIQKFSDIYEKIENNWRKQMLELEKMRIDFQRQLEMQRRQILERAQSEIAKIRQGGGDDDDDENDIIS